MTSRELRASGELMDALGAKARANICSVLPSVRRRINERGSRAFARDDPISAGMLANEAVFLKKLQRECRGTNPKRNRTYTRTDEY